MAIKVTWPGVVQGNPSKYEIYRASTRATVYQPENLIHTVTDGATKTWTDTTALNDVVYYYGVNAHTDMGEVISPIRIGVTHVNIVGAGSSIVIGGTSDDGVMERFITGSQVSIASIMRSAIYGLSTVPGITVVPRTESIAITGEVAGASKISYNGKIIYIDEDPRLGLNGATALINSTVLDKFVTNPIIVSDGLYKYKVRLMTRNEFDRYQLCMGNYGEELRMITPVTQRPATTTFIFQVNGVLNYAVSNNGTITYTTSTALTSNLTPAIVLEPTD